MVVNLLKTSLYRFGPWSVFVLIKTHQLPNTQKEKRSKTNKNKKITKSFVYIFPMSFISARSCWLVVLSKQGTVEIVQFTLDELVIDIKTNNNIYDICIEREGI